MVNDAIFALHTLTYKIDVVVQYLWWSDPFLEFYRRTETGWLLAHRTEVSMFTITAC